MVSHCASIVRRTRVAVTTVVLLALVQGQGCPELDNLPFDIEQLIGSLTNGGGPFQDRDRCERDCEEDAEQFLEGCRAGLPEDASPEAFEACEVQAGDRLDTCKVDCRPDEDDRHRGPGCERACIEESDWVFEDCAALLGEDATHEDFEACKKEAHEFRHDCKRDCRWDREDDRDHGDGCERACIEESDWVFEDCAALLGEDATEEDYEACEEEAEAFRHECKEGCPSDDDHDEHEDDDDECKEACVEASDAAFEACVDERTADAEEVCDAEAVEHRDACKNACPLDDDDCEEACVEDADSVFDDCFEALNDEAHDACEMEADELRDACKDDCESDDGNHDEDEDKDECEEACVDDSVRFLDECVDGLDETATDVDFEDCEEDAEALRETCKEDCESDDGDEDHDDDD